VLDLHTHLVPGVDDGARTAGAGAAVLERFSADGVRTVVCTPHARASAVARGALADAPAVRAAFDALRALAPGDLDLRLGREVMLDEPGADLAGCAEVLLDGGPAVLVEFPRGPVPVAAARELERLRAGGLRPILAHPERYADVTVDAVRAWRDAGAAAQVDATTLCGTGPRARLARALVAAGEADLLASDNHGDGRSLAAARAWLAEHGASEVADVLTRENPARLLRGADPVPLPPSPALGHLGGALADWLRARFGHRRPAAAGPRLPESVVHAGVRP
jgi:protein-tyrosine phosphatase